MTPDLDPERRLALAYVPAARRAALAALWDLDVTLGAVLATGSDPMISQIRLAWWREALEKLDHAGPPAEPLLQALARHVLPAGIGGAELAAMEEGWTLLLAPDPLGPEALHHYAETRGGRLFALSARLLGADAPGIEAAGARPSEARWPVPLRPLGMLAALARRDAARGLPLEAQGSPARMLRMLRHRLTGR